MKAAREAGKLRGMYGEVVACCGKVWWNDGNGRKGDGGWRGEGR